MNWEEKCQGLIERWAHCQMGLLSEERWEAERNKFYGQVRDQMIITGNDFFFKDMPSLKRLVQIMSINDKSIDMRIDELYEHLVTKAKLNEVSAVLETLDKIMSLNRKLMGPYGYVIWQCKPEGFDVEED